jgi:hypothetical protein
MIPKSNITVGLTPEIRLYKALKQAGVKKPVSVRSLTITGTVAIEDFHFIHVKMRRTLQVLNLSEASIEDNKIPDWAFNHCIGLKSVTIPGSVTKIGNCAFWECTGLTSVNIDFSEDFAVHSSEIEIGADAFFNCRDIVSNMVIPERTTDANLNDIIEVTTFNKQCDLRTWLTEYLPDIVIEEVVGMLQEYHIHLKITKTRRSVSGTYIPPHGRNYHVITINGNLNKYEFMEVFLHEYAHLLIQVNYGQSNGISGPHGIEWKNAFRSLLHHFIQKGFFPAEISIALQNYMVKTYAKGTMMLDSVLRRYGTRKNSDSPFDFCCNSQ